MIGVGLSLPQVAVRRVAAAASGPTVILNANWLTDTLLNEGLSPISNGNDVESWAFATGGTATGTLAIAAGAVDRCLYSTANGVQTNGLSAALTCATPVTIPADTDFDLWVYCVVNADFSNGYYLGSTSSDCVVVANCDTDITFYLDAFTSATTGAPAPAGVTLLRFARVAGLIRLAFTGSADATTGTTFTGAISFNTLHGAGTAGTLNTFSAGGNYLRAARITTYPDGYADRASYRSTYETSLIGSALT